VRKAMRLNGVEALVVEHRLNKTAGSGISVDSGDDVSPEGFAEHRLVLERIVVRLTYHVGRHVGLVQTLAPAMSHCGFERVVMKNIFVDESGEFGLAAGDVLRFNADTRPDRIDLIEAPCGPRLKLSHERGSPDASRSPTWVFSTNSKMQGGPRNAASA